MDQATLLSKAWYRGLKVLYFLALAAALLMCLFVVYWVTGEKVPTYRTLGNVNGKPTIEFGNGTRVGFNGAPSTLDIAEVADNIDLPSKYYHVRMGWPEIIGSYILAISTIAIMFYLVARVFFYIIVGGPFLRLRKRPK